MGKTLYNINTKHMQSELWITNLLSEEGESLQETCKNFFKEKLGITQELGLSDVRRKGGENGPVVVRVGMKGAKKLIFNNVTKLKDQKNAKGKAYGVSSHLPEAENKNDLRKRQIVQQNIILPKAQQKISLKKGVLTINGKVYRDRVQEFTVAQIQDRSQSSHTGTKFCKT